MAKKEFQSDIRKAVEELVYIIEQEAATPSAERNVEIVIAARKALLALIGSERISKAKEFLVRG